MNLITFLTLSLSDDSVKKSIALTLSWKTLLITWMNLVVSGCWKKPSHSILYVMQMF